MKKTILFVALLLMIAAIAVAADVTITWTAPTNYTDGTEIPLSDLSYVIGYGPVSRGAGTMYANQVNVPTPGTAACSYVLSLTTGTWFASVRAVSNQYGTSGAWSNEISKVVPGTPGPPTNVTIGTVSAS